MLLPTWRLPPLLLPFPVGLSIQIHLIEVFVVEIFQLGIQGAKLCFFRFFCARPINLALLHGLKSIELALFNQLGCFLN